MKFIMLVGLPGSGKSTFAESLKEQGYVVHSPDKIRNELNLHDIEDTKKVFNILYENIFNDMEQGKDIVYDSVNLIRRRRKEFLRLIKKYNYEKICYVFIVPLEICKERNDMRVGYSKVKDSEYLKMLNCFNPVFSDEGWDKIIYKLYEEKENNL